MPASATLQGMSRSDRIDELRDDIRELRSIVIEAANAD